MASLIREDAFAGSRRAKYKVDDGTGSIEVWRTFAQSHGRGDPSPNVPGVEKDEEWESRVRLDADYVRIVGNLQYRTGVVKQLQIQATSVQSIGNFGEVTHHLLAAMAATMWYEKGAPVC